ncbi:hypothetical protein K431DRAFT_287457 [Polychaeton citri CBS 116435]|uniref:Uncharacterized protein n=1 Tax=Polychaeton citri CBS 116435 TaxID=1314669 RepID=A0A9P4Q2S5_9PEZI|nr:hypothetical protein K431DRAFT_287457 [Polychaeton citri CBS 116435]
MLGACSQGSPPSLHQHSGVAVAFQSAGIVAPPTLTPTLTLTYTHTRSHTRPPLHCYIPIPVVWFARFSRQRS